MTPGIIIPLIVLPIALLGFWRWYQRSIRTPQREPTPPISGTRLTGQALHRLPAPPWRIVYEIGTRLPGIDHLAIGRAGIVAIRTAASDRPTIGQLTEHQTMAALVADSAIARNAVDELLRGTDARCGLLARVYWGRPDAHRHAAEESIHATALVEGQRLTEWLDDWNTHAPAVFDQPAVDDAWRTLITGLGRPDPLP